MKMKKKKFMGLGAVLWVWLSIGLCAAMVVVSLVRLEHYNRVYDDAITVTATVTRHDEDSNADGDTTYRSYISYEVEDVRYKNIHYESKPTEKKLTPKGEEVTVQVSPEDPSELISSLKSNKGMFAVALAILLLIVCAGVCNVQPSAGNAAPSMDRILRDAKKKAISRFSNLFFLLLGLGYTAACLRYPTAFGGGMWFAIGVIGIVWLINMAISLRQLRSIQNGQLRTHWDRVIKKSARKDSDGDDTYHLQYGSQGLQWEEKVTRERFDRTGEGSFVLAAYLPGDKKPFVYYDTDGRAYF